MSAPIEIKFWMVDDWNRPVFISKSKHLFGSTDKLFDFDANAETVLETVTCDDITYFGWNITHDPMGSQCHTKIVKEFTDGII